MPKVVKAESPKAIDRRWKRDAHAPPSLFLPWCLVLLGVGDLPYALGALVACLVRNVTRRLRIKYQECPPRHDLTIPR